MTTRITWCILSETGIFGVVHLAENNSGSVRTHAETWTTHISRVVSWPELAAVSRDHLQTHLVFSNMAQKLYTFGVESTQHYFPDVPFRDLVPWSTFLHNHPRCNTFRHVHVHLDDDITDKHTGFDMCREWGP